MKYKLGYYLHYLEEDLDDLLSKIMDRYYDHPLIFEIFWRGIVPAVLSVITSIIVIKLLR